MAEVLMGVPFEYEPKRQNRFFVEFPDDVGIEVWKVRTIKRPSWSSNVIEVPYINQKNYVAGIYAWEAMDITFIDPIGPSTSNQVMEWVRLHAESLTGRMGYAAGYKKNILVKALDPTGVEVEKWFLEQCMLSSVDFGDNDQSQDELQMITATIQPWRCILNY